MDDKEKKNTSRKGLWLFLAGFLLGGLCVGGASALATVSSLKEMGQKDVNLIHALATCKTTFSGRVNEINANKVNKMDDQCLAIMAALDARTACEDGVAEMYRGATK